MRSADPGGQALRLNLLRNARILVARVFFSFRFDPLVHCLCIHVRESLQKEGVWQHITTATVLFLKCAPPNNDEYPLWSLVELHAACDTAHA